MNISFALTTPQFKDRSKDVTRRLGWARLKAGAILTGIKGQGLKKGEKIAKLGQIRVVSVRLEPLSDILLHPEEVLREGFPDLTPWEFVDMFCEANDCLPDRIVTRIEFAYV